MEQQYFIEQDCESIYGESSPGFQFFQSFQLCVQQTYSKSSPNQKQISVSRLQISADSKAEANQGINHLKTILMDYFRSNYEEIEFKVNLSAIKQKGVVIQLKKQYEGQNQLLQQHMHPFFEQCIQKNDFVKILVSELKLINKKYIIPEIIYLVANITYQFYYYIEMDISAPSMLQKCKKSVKNLTEKVLNQQKIKRILFRNDDFEQISDRDQAFEQLVYKLSLIIWMNSMQKTKEKFKYFFLSQFQNIKESDQKKTEVNSVSNLELIDLQTNCAYFSDSQQDQDMNRTVKEKMTMSNDTYFVKKESLNSSNKKNRKVDIPSLSQLIQDLSGLDDDMDSLSE